MRKIFLFMAAAVVLIVSSCAKENNQMNMTEPAETESIVGKTFYTDRFCNLTSTIDEYCYSQYEFLFSSDGKLFIREYVNNGWKDPMLWTYSIDNSMITVEGDYGDSHLIKRGYQISSNVIRWGDSQEGDFENDSRLIEGWGLSFTKVFDWHLSISTKPVDITEDWFGWVYDADSLPNNSSYLWVKMGRRHCRFFWCKNGAPSEPYWEMEIVFPNVVFRKRYYIVGGGYRPDEGETIAKGKFVDNGQKLQIQFVNGSFYNDSTTMFSFTRRPEK